MQGLSIIEKAALNAFRGLGLSPEAKVLDAPCGQGELVLALREAHADAWGADLEADAEPLLQGRFLRADLNTDLPWPDMSFDALLSIEGIEHLENWFQFLREAHRVLRPGGVLILTTPNIVSLRSRVRYFGSAFFHKDPRPLNESRRHPLHHIGLATFPELRYALHTSGFVLSNAGATHVKPVSYLYAALAPWMYVYTRQAFRKEKDPVQRRRNREILSSLFSPALLFGENLLIIAKRVDKDPC